MFKQKIKKLYKVVILGLLGLILANTFLFDVSFIGVQSVYAATGIPGNGGGGAGGGSDKTESGNGMQKFAETLETLNHVMYVMMWPMLALAGISMDNEFVYGKFFKLDIALWKFWTMTRAFTNYVLGFFFIYSVLMYFFNFKQDKHSPKKILPKILVTAILIQASWFLLGAMVDISTIATYGIGALPLKAIQGMDIGKSPLLLPNIEIDLRDNAKTSDDQGNIANFVGGSSDSPTKYGICKAKADNESFEFMGSAEGLDPTYCVYSHPKFNWILIEKSAKKTQVNNDNDAKKKSDEALQKAAGGEDKALSLQNVIKFGKGMTGPFFALYASLMNMVSVTASNKSTSTLTVEFLLKGIVTFALLIPLFALAVVMIIRIVYMWLYIGFSPIIALMAGLKGVLDVKGDEKTTGKFQLSTVIGLVFMPVIAVFALSISIIFLSALLKGPVSTTETNNGMWSGMGITISNPDGKTCMEIDKLKAKMCVTNKGGDISISTFFNMFSRIMVNMFGIALMRTVVFAALKSSKITEGVVGKIEGFAKGMVGAAPIIPVPGVGNVGFSSLGSAMTNIKNMPSRWQEQNYNDKLKPVIDRLSGANNGAGGAGGSGGAGGAGGSGSGSGSDFDKAVRSGDNNKIMDAWNKAHPGEKVDNADKLTGNKSFRDEMSKNKDYFDKIDVNKLKEIAKNTNPDKKDSVIDSKTSGLKYIYVKEDDKIYKSDNNKVTGFINVNNVSDRDLQDFVNNFSKRDKADLENVGFPVKFKIDGITEKSIDDVKK